MTNAHLINGEFQSDKYPTCPRGKVPLSVRDKTAQDLLWEYAQRRRMVDVQFSDALEIALLNAGYRPPQSVHGLDGANESDGLMTKQQQEAFDRFWKRMVEGCPMTDNFEVGVVKAHTEAAFVAGWKNGKKQKCARKDELASPCTLP